MSDHQCEAVRSWLRERDPALPEIPPPELVAHVAGCSACRGLLAALAANLVRVPAAQADLQCADCQSALDAYIDCERRHGVAAAIQRYPDLWWHLWTCADCAEVYHLTNALVDAEEQVAIPIPITAAPEPQPRLARLLKVQLARAFLHGVFAPQAALGAAWSGGEDESLFAEEQLEDYHIALHVWQRGAIYWGIGITVTPPLTGWAVLSFGELRFSAPFDQHGRAVITEIPHGLLTDRAGPDMLMTIEPHDTSA
jgi:hypothetical protein